MAIIDRINRALDELPRVRFFTGARPVPAFRSCGVAGFYVAVTVTLAVGLARGRSLLVLASLCAVCGASFFAYAHARRWLTGRENLVLLEHVWFAVACCAAALWAMGMPMLAYLDAVACGLAFFLMAGRVGCCLVGCCHGFPASVGFRYGEGHALDGFAAEWVGVRLFPVQLVEAVGLGAIGVACVVFALVARDGTAFALLLTSYAVMRFGLEGIRADPRPHLLGISQSRWMAMAELAGGVLLLERGQIHLGAAAVAAVPGIAFVGWRAWQSAFGLRSRALRSRHLDALRSAVGGAPAGTPIVSATALEFRAGSSDGGRLISLSSSRPEGDTPFLCALAAAAFPEMEARTATLTPSGVLVFELPGGAAERRMPPAPLLGYRAFGACAQKAQSAREVSAESPSGEDARPSQRTGYFTGASGRAGG